MSGLPALPDPIIPDVRSRKLRSQELKTGLTPRHQALLDNMLMNPLWSREQHAKMLGVTPMTIYNIQRSDAFQALWVERRRGLDKIYEQQTTAKVEAIIAKGLDRMNAALDDPEVDPNYALSVFEKTHKIRFGDPRYAEKIPGVPHTTVNIAVASSDLSEARTLISRHAKSELELQVESCSDQL